MGYKDVEEAEDGQIAVDKFKQLSPDLVMLDITMPKLDGIGALQEIREHNPNAKVVMCSTMGQEAIVMQTIKLGAMDFIVKPFKPDRIEKTMKAIFE